MSSSSMHIEAFFDDATSTVSYIVLDRDSMSCAIVDSVLDYDPKAGRTSTASADRVIARVTALGARLEWILETHVHADHLSAAPWIQKHLGGKLGIGSNIVAVQKVFGKLFNAGTDFERDGSQFDHLFEDDERFTIGTLQARALHTPGHTPACMSYLIEDAAFVGDTLFMPDYGTARCDFPGGDARTLYRSVRRLLALPPQTRLFMCHDYMPGGRAARWESSVAEELRDNIHVHEGITEDDFVAMRTARDATLDMPVLMLPSVQVNMRAGHLPAPEDNGTRYMKIPIDVL
ncbi:MAG: MBL fold metallo-hydrolase [Gammaproteobacteria bacterium]|jgi:glyoxylase-like metal-dependent hydrolase (beta-lactamase superfamily II)|nr:MBL fold metallo-hydrolase [Gammaproteobacteria bacterium]MBU0770750.1 MBL fold metallo-hydrolase [Gammaproteobacteria bacterium]MBU0857624.1 MBL fold metallo-hydrolase [Gammaproteobacteria bacterium]MBU1848632.1 MBL fold metallo-hydrolase [Gammaproteobacteria bacterium]